MSVARKGFRAHLRPLLFNAHHQHHTTAAMSTTTTITHPDGTTVTCTTTTAAPAEKIVLKYWNGLSPVFQGQDIRE